MTPELYGAIRAILRENGVKTLQGPSCENIPSKAEHEGERWRIMAPLRNENCMETREGGAGKQLLPASLLSLLSVEQKNCAVKNESGIRFRQSHLNFW